MNKLGFTCADILRMSASISNALTLFACLRVELAKMARGHPIYFILFIFFKMVHAIGMFSESAVILFFFNFFNLTFIPQLRNDKNCPLPPPVMITLVFPGRELSKEHCALLDSESKVLFGSPSPA